MAIDAGENFAVSALVSVVLLDGVLLERLAARVAREEHHDDFSRFHETFTSSRVIIYITCALHERSCFIGEVQ